MLLWDSICLFKTCLFSFLGFEFIITSCGVKCWSNTFKRKCACQRYFRQALQISQLSLKIKLSLRETKYLLSRQVFGSRSQVFSTAPLINITSPHSAVASKECYFWLWSCKKKKNPQRKSVHRVFIFFHTLSCNEDCSFFPILVKRAKPGDCNEKKGGGQMRKQQG